MIGSIRVKGKLSEEERVNLWEATGDIGYLHWTTVSATTFLDFLNYLKAVSSHGPGSILSEMIGAARTDLVAISNEDELRRLTRVSEFVFAELCRRKIPVVRIPEAGEVFEIRFDEHGCVVARLREGNVSLRVLTDASLELKAGSSEIVSQKLVWDGRGYRGQNGYLPMDTKFIGIEIFEGCFVKAEEVYGSILSSIAEGSRVALENQDTLEIA